MTRQLKLRLDKLDEDLVLPDDVELVQTMKKQARKVLRAAELEEYRTHKLRREYQLELQAKYEEDGDKKMANVIRRLRNAEETRRAWLKCAYTRGKIHNGGLVGLEVPRDPLQPPKTCDDWMYLDDPVEVEKHIQTQLKEHFSQAEETDFRQSPLKEDTNFSADTDTARKLLNGDIEYEQGKLRLSTLMLLQHCARDPVNEITTTLTDKQFDGKLKSWN
jgi:hypothetical protein